MTFFSLSRHVVNKHLGKLQRSGTLFSHFNCSLLLLLCVCLSHHSGAGCPLTPLSLSFVLHNFLILSQPWVAPCPAAHCTSCVCSALHTTLLPPLLLYYCLPLSSSLVHTPQSSISESHFLSSQMVIFSIISPSRWLWWAWARRATRRRGPWRAGARRHQEKGRIQVAIR